MMELLEEPSKEIEQRRQQKTPRITFFSSSVPGSVSKIVAFVASIITVVKTTNLITNLPAEVQIFEKDQVGFHLYRFMNGSMIDASYFQKPYLEA